jgi:spore coat protein U-like protein
MGPSSTTLLRLFLALLAGFAGMPAYAQTTTGTVRVSVATSTTLSKTGDLHFGSITPSGTAGTVTVSPAGVRTSNGGVILAGGSPTAASFSGQGSRNQQIRITFDILGATLNRTIGGASMTANNFIAQGLLANGLAPLGSSGTGQRFRIAATSGAFSFTVGARLNVSANQAPGAYVGTFDVTVDFQ